eukprot:COSAG02_NODE_3708_length_6351_cov_1.684101_6_plen_175_part_00
MAVASGRAGKNTPVSGRKPRYSPGRRALSSRSVNSVWLARTPTTDKRKVATSGDGPVRAFSDVVAESPFASPAGGCAICCWGESYAVGKLSRVAEVTYIPCRWLIARGAVGRNLNAGMEQDRIPTANGTAYVPVVPQALRAPSQSGSAPFTNPSHALDCLPTRSGAPTSGAAAS